MEEQKIIDTMKRLTIPVDQSIDDLLKEYKLNLMDYHDELELRRTIDVVVVIEYLRSEGFTDEMIRKVNSNGFINSEVPQLEAV